MGKWLDKVFRREPKADDAIADLTAALDRFSNAMGESTREMRRFSDAVAAVSIESGNVRLTIDFDKAVERAGEPESDFEAETPEGAASDGETPDGPENPSDDGVVDTGDWLVGTMHGGPELEIDPDTGGRPDWVGRENHGAGKHKGQPRGPDAAPRHYREPNADGTCVICGDPIPPRDPDARGKPRTLTCKEECGDALNLLTTRERLARKRAERKVTAPADRPCSVCGKPVPPALIARLKNRVTCSTKCASEWRTKTRFQREGGVPRPRGCAHCGEPIPVERLVRKGRPAVTCSDECTKLRRRERDAAQYAAKQAAIGKVVRPRKPKANGRTCCMCDKPIPKDRIEQHAHVKTCSPQCTADRKAARHQGNGNG